MRGNGNAPQRLRVRKARENKATRTTAAPKPAGGTDRPPTRVGAGAKGADPGKPAGTPYRGPRKERNLAPVVEMNAHLRGAPR